MKLRYLLALLLIAYLLTGVYQVGPDERAVVRRFGKVVARPGPGLGFGLPWGIDRVDRVPVRTVRQLRIEISIWRIEVDPVLKDMTRWAMQNIGSLFNPGSPRSRVPGVDGPLV